MSKLLAIITGGTPDAIGETYSPEKDCEFNPEGKSAAWQIIQTLWKGRLDLYKPFLKDSKYIIDDEISRITKAINDSDAHYVLITYGTDRMVQAAKAIEARIKDKTKTIFITGGMWPIDCGEKSDAPTNLQFACENISEHAHGVFIIGKQLGSDVPKVFNIHNVEKDRANLVFKELDLSYLRQK